MSILAMKDSLSLRKAGSVLGRASLSEEVIRCIGEFTGGYAEAMILAGKLKAIAQAAQFDDYWAEKFDIGYQRELNRLLGATRTPRPSTITPDAGASQ